MHHEKAAGSAKRAIKGVGKTNIEGQVFTGIRVHLVWRNVIKSLGRLPIALGNLRSKLSRILTDRIGVEQHEPAGPVLLPDLQRAFLLIDAVEEMVGVLWRKRRLRLAETAAYRRGLKNAVSPDQQVTNAALAHLDIGKQTAAATTMELADLDQRESIITRALGLLQAGKVRAYDKALCTLSEETRERWSELIKPKPALGLLMFDNTESRYTANADGLIDYLQEVVMPSYNSRRKELQNRPLIQEQASWLGPSTK